MAEISFFQGTPKGSWYTLLSSSSVKKFLFSTILIFFIININIRVNLYISINFIRSEINNYINLVKNLSNQNDKTLILLNLRVDL